MTTLCRCDWNENFGTEELRHAQIDPQKLPVTSFEKIAATGQCSISAEAIGHELGSSPATCFRSD